jgi:DNA-binding NarL/FixJ family response regulator
MRYIRIAVYHGNRQQNDKLCRSIEEILGSFKKNGEIVSFLSPASFSAALDKETFAILIIASDDIQLREKVAILRLSDPMFSLILIADDNFESAKKLLKLGVVGLITDPSSFSDINTAISAAIEEQTRYGMSVSGERFSLRTRDKILSLPYSEIDYFSNLRRKVTMHSSARREKIEWNAKFSDIYNSLPKRRFIRCHQSFIVNMEKIHIINRADSEIILNNGESIYISKLNHAETFAAYQQYLGIETEKNVEKILM